MDALLAEPCGAVAALGEGGGTYVPLPAAMTVAALFAQLKGIAGAQVGFAICQRDRKCFPSGRPIEPRKFSEHKGRR